MINNLSVKNYASKLGAGWMIVSAFCFAVMGVFVKLAGMNGYHFIELVFWRGVFGVFLMGLIAYKKQQTLKTPALSKHLFRSFAGMISMFAYFYAISKLPIATATTLNYTSPVFMVIVCTLLFRQKINRFAVIGIATGFFGVLLLLQPNFSNNAWIAIMIGLSSGLISSIAYIQIQQLTRLNEPEWRIVFYFSLVMCVCSAIILTLTNNWYFFSPTAFHYIIGMGVCATIAQITMTKAYKESNLFVVSACSYTTIIFSTIFGAWLLHDVLHWTELLAMAIIVLSGFLTKIGDLAIFAKK